MQLGSKGSLFWAAKSLLPLLEVCERVQATFGLNPFGIDTEVEGEDWWSYGTSQNTAIDFNITSIGEYRNPALWKWMWGAPAEANYQIIVMWDRQGPKPDLVLIERELATILGCRLVRYPGFDD